MNAASHQSVTSECDGGVKFARLVMEADSAAIWLRDGVRVGWGVSEAQAAFVTTLESTLALASAPLQKASSRQRLFSTVTTKSPVKNAQRSPAPSIVERSPPSQAAIA